MLVAPTIGQNSGNMTYDETSAAEQICFSITSVTSPATVGSILLDMSNVTQDTTISLYIRIDGVNYTKVQENNWTTTDDPGVMIDGFVTPSYFRVTLQCGGAGLGDVNVPWSVQ